MKFKILILFGLFIFISLITLFIQETLFSQLQQDIYTVCCNGTSLYTRPNMRYRTRLYLKRGQDVIVSQIYTMRSRASYDFARINYNGNQYYVPLQLITKKPLESTLHYDNSGNLLIGRETVNKWISLPMTYAPNDLVTAPKAYAAPGYQFRPMQFRREAWLAFKRMIDDAAKQGYIIRLISCYRSSSTQCIPYMRSLRISPKQTGSAKPGHSEHQLGTVADVSVRRVGWQLTQRLHYTPEHRWIRRNARKYGIYVSYPRGTKKGYMWEPWHLRYWGSNIQFKSYHSPE